MKNYLEKYYINNYLKLIIYLFKKKLYFFNFKRVKISR